VEDRAPTREVPPSESHEHHEESDRGKVVRFCFLQQRTELDFWHAIDKLGDYGQKHELLLQRIISRQWKLFALIAFSIGLQLLHMSAQAKAWLTTMMPFMTR
jgi:hypothetical protein